MSETPRRGGPGSERRGTLDRALTNTDTKHHSAATVLTLYVESHAPARHKNDNATRKVSRLRASAATRPTRQRVVLRGSCNAHRNGGHRLQLAADAWLVSRGAPSRSRSIDPLRSRAPRRRRSGLLRLRRPGVGRWAHERARGWAWWARIGQAGGGQVAGAPITMMLSAESTRRKRSEECTSGAQAPPPPRACCAHLRRPRFKRSQEVDCEMCARDGLGVRRRTRLPQHGMQLF